jgi:hypothetical protein
MKNDAENDAENASKYVSTYTPKPDTWRQAGWLPLLVAGVIVGIVFTIGMKSNATRLKAKRAAEQAVIDAKNGVIRTEQEGVFALKLVEEKSVTGAEGAVVVTVKNVKATDTDLAITFDIQNKFKGNIHQLDCTLIDISQNGKEIKSLEKAAELGLFPTNLSNSVVSNTKTVHFSYAISDARQFLLYAKFAVEGMDFKGNIAVPFQLK